MLYWKRIMNRRFCVFIITNGRPYKVYTYKTIREQGYTGDVIFVVDNLDSTKEEYIKKFGENNVYIFDKLKIAERTDDANTDNKLNAIIYGRNVCFDIAREKGYTHFLELDDDYTSFMWRRENEEGKLQGIFSKDLDSVFSLFCDFMDNTPTYSICFAQGGDFIGGKDNKGLKDGLKRKAMNSFFCKTDRYFQFVGKINEDVNTYVLEGSRGKLFFTYTDFMLTQKQTQKTKGGMSDLYLDVGTYVKSFYSIIYCPSSVSIALMGDKHKRVHHKVSWDNAVPKILNQKYKRV